MTKLENAQQIKVLEKIRQQVASNGSPLYSGCGLCYNVEQQGGSRIQPALYALGLTFEPIPHYHIHQDSHTLWSGKQRELRLALIEKLITYYQEQN